MLQTETADDTEKTQAPDVGGSEVARQLAEVLEFSLIPNWSTNWPVLFA